MTQLINPNLTTPATQHFRQTSHVVATTIPSAPLFKDLAFPLNVYAHALLLEEGKAAYLHYGLFQHDKANLQTAQQYSTDLVISKLPPPPSNILEVGVGLGTTFSLLVERGYKVHGITPDAQQIAFIRHLFGSDIPVSCHALEDFAATVEAGRGWPRKEDSQRLPGAARRGLPERVGSSARLGFTALRSELVANRYCPLNVMKGRQRLQVVVRLHD